MPLLRELPGFREYNLLEGRPDVLISIRVFDSADEALASNEIAADRFRNNVLEFVKGMPEVMADRCGTSSSEGHPTSAFVGMTGWDDPVRAFAVSAGPSPQVVAAESTFRETRQVWRCHRVHPHELNLVSSDGRVRQDLRCHCEHVPGGERDWN